MQSTKSSANLQETFSDQIKAIGVKRGKMELLTSMLGFRALESHQRMSDANREAESQAVRKAAWGVDSPTQTAGTDDMGDTILGDVTTHPTPIVVAGESGGTMKALATLAIGGLLAGSGAGLGAGAMYLLSNRDQATPVVPEGERVQIGLGRIEDYVGGSE